MAGGFKQFGPTYKTTDIIRLGYEGYINGDNDTIYDEIQY